MASLTQWRIEGDGALTPYPDPFREVTPAQAAEAERMEGEILRVKHEVERGFFELAWLLDRFERERLYLGRGYERMRDWCESPEVELSWRVVHDLLRIVRELVPSLERAGMTGDDARAALQQLGVSKTRALLPLLRTDDGPARLPELIQRSEHLRWRDVVAEVKDVVSSKTEEPRIVFHAYVDDLPSLARVRVVGTDGERYETLGTLHIPHPWLGKFIDRFSKFVEFRTVTQSG